MGTRLPTYVIRKDAQRWINLLRVRNLSVFTTFAGGERRLQVVVGKRMNDRFTPTVEFSRKTRSPRS